MCVCVCSRSLVICAFICDVWSSSAALIRLASKLKPYTSVFQGCHDVNSLLESPRLFYRDVTSVCALLYVCSKNLHGQHLLLRILSEKLNAFFILSIKTRDTVECIAINSRGVFFYMCKSAEMFMT